jgi:hypothetical protein
MFKLICLTFQLESYLHERSHSLKTQFRQLTANQAPSSPPLSVMADRKDKYLEKKDTRVTTEEEADSPTSCMCITRRCSSATSNSA